MQELAITSSPLEFTELRRRMQLQFEAQYGLAVRGCARVTSRAFCRARFEVDANGIEATASGVELLYCRTDAAASELNRIRKCFEEHAGEVQAVPVADLSSELQVYQGDLDLSFDWDCQSC